MDNRYYFSCVQGEKVVLTDGEAQHLSKVRRAKLGDKIVAFNGDGYDYNLEITNITKDKVEAKVLSKQLNKATIS